MFNRLTNTRRKDARLIREEAAELAALRPHPDHINNGEEERYRRPNGKLSYIANYSKGLRHNGLGEVVPDAYRTLLRAMYSTDPIRFERTSMMGTLNGGKGYLGGSIQTIFNEPNDRRRLRLLLGGGSP